MTNLKQGDRVMFGRTHGEQTLGEIVKVNRTRVHVRQLEGRGIYRNYPAGTVWVVPFRLCSKAGEVTTKRPETEVLVEIRNIYCQLSPENLSCDGELSRTEVRRRSSALESRLRSCFQELGREVSESEAFGF